MLRRGVIACDEPAFVAHPAGADWRRVSGPSARALLLLLLLLSFRRWRCACGVRREHYAHCFYPLDASSTADEATQWLSGWMIVFESH